MNHHAGAQRWWQKWPEARLELDAGAQSGEAPVAYAPVDLAASGGGAKAVQADLGRAEAGTGRSRLAARLPVSANVIPGLVSVVDSAVILGSGAITYVLLVNYDNDLVPTYGAAVSFIWITTLLVFQFAGLYQFDAIIKPWVFVNKLVVAFLTAFLFLLAGEFAIKVTATFSRLWTGSFAISACLGTLLARVVVGQTISRLSNLGIFVRKVVVAGSGEQIRRLLTYITASNPRFVSVLGVFTDGSNRRTRELCGYPVLGSFGDLPRFVRSQKVDDAIIALPWAAEGETLKAVEKLRELPLNVYLSSDLVGFRLNFQAPPSHFGTIPILEVVGRPLSGWSVVVKAIEDYLLAGLATLLMSPLMALIAVAVKLDSPGPVLFRQKRLGFNNQAFEIYKFRTMRHRPLAEKTTVQARPNDPRVTAVGRFLRRTSLDELPQLFNVFNGTMSIVGPRPHAVDHNKAYGRKIESYFARHRIKPGITGWAQVNGLRGETVNPELMEARVRHDNYYMEHWSLLFDLNILARTAVIVLTGRNAY